VSAADETSPISSWGGASEYVDRSGTGRTYHLSDEEYRAGLIDSPVVRLLAWCRQAGVPYHLSSGGDYECAGEIRQWVPGMAEEFRVRADAGEEPFITEAVWHRLVEEHVKPVASVGAQAGALERLTNLVAAVDRRFGVGILPPGVHPSLAAWNPPVVTGRGLSQ
jgi:hypothetical protein